MPLPNLAPTPMPRLTPGTVTTVMEDIGGDIEDTTDLMDTMDTMERDLLMKLPLPNLAPTPMPRLTPGTVTTVTDTMVTTERDLLMMLPRPNLAPTLMPRLTPGTVTTGTVTGLTVMVTTGTGLTGDKKWTSTTSNNIRSFPTDSSLNASFCKTIFFLLF